MYFTERDGFCMIDFIVDLIVCLIHHSVQSKVVSLLLFYIIKQGSFRPWVQLVTGMGTGKEKKPEGKILSDYC